MSWLPGGPISVKEFSIEEVRPDGADQLNLQKEKQIAMAVVGLVFNLKKDLVADEDDPPDAQAELDGETTVLAIAQSLRRAGHEVILIDGDERAWEKLSHKNIDIVFNISEGLRGESRESQIPALLEMLGIPYTGSGVLTLAVTLDKPTTKKILAYHGLPTPRFVVVPPGQEPDDTGLRYPLFVKPAHEGSSMGVSPSSKVTNAAELKREVEKIHQLYRQEALVEEYLPGREFTVGILGNESPTIFPIMEINFSQCPPEHNNVYSRQFKVEWDDERFFLCPAPLTLAEEEKIKDLALKAFRVLGCRDVARIDLRLDQEGNPYVLEINPLPGLAPGYSDLPRAAAVAGVSFDELVQGILDHALDRYGLGYLKAKPQEMIA